jgi:hypothetical protein
MPLHIDIHLNHERLHTIHIGRWSGGQRPDDINVYRAVVTLPGETNVDYLGPDSVEYTHRYGDGADICVARAIEALYANPGRTTFATMGIRGDLDEPGETHRIPEWFRFTDTPQGPTTPWGLQPFGYHYTGGPIGSTNWVLPVPHPVYLNIFLDEPYIFDETAASFPGRITVIADTDNHFDDWTSISSGKTVHVSEKNLGHTRGYAVWSTRFTTAQEFLTALRHADTLVRDPEITLTEAFLAAAAQPEADA